MVTPYEVLAPCVTVRLEGEAESEKFGGTLVTVTLAVPFTLPLDAVTVNGAAVLPAVNKPLE